MPVPSEKVDEHEDHPRQRLDAQLRRTEKTEQPNALLAAKQAAATAIPGHASLEEKNAVLEAQWRAELDAEYATSYDAGFPSTTTPAPPAAEPQARRGPAPASSHNEATPSHRPRENKN